MLRVASLVHCAAWWCWRPPSTPRFFPSGDSVAPSRWCLYSYGLDLLSFHGWEFPLLLVTHLLTRLVSLEASHCSRPFFSIKMLPSFKATEPNHQVKSLYSCSSFLPYHLLPLSYVLVFSLYIKFSLKKNFYNRHFKLYREKKDNKPYF